MWSLGWLIGVAFDELVDLKRVWNFWFCGLLFLMLLSMQIKILRFYVALFVI